MATTELTKQEEAQQEVSAEEAHGVAMQIKVALADGREALWRLAEALYAWEEMRGWERLDYETRSAWLADADVTLTRSTYERLVRTWRKLIVERKVDAEHIRQLDQSKVAIVTDAIVENKVPVSEALADAEALGAQDLREKYFGPKKPNPVKTEQAESGRTSDGDAVEAQSEPEPETTESEPESQPDVVSEEEDQEPTSEPEDEPSSSDALVDAGTLPWEELRAAYECGASFPRVKRDTIGLLLQWQKTHLS